MSHVAEMKINITSLEVLARAVQRIGMRLELNVKTYKWYGRHVGDYPLPEGFKKEDLGKCDHVIRIPGDDKAYEIGVVTKPNGGYQLLWDFWQGGFGLTKKVGKGGGLLTQAYAIQAAKEQMLRDGFRATEAQDAKGNILLTFIE